MFGKLNLTKKKIYKITSRKQFEPKGAFLNTKNTIMDAENFYIQSKNLRDSNKIFEEIK